MKVRAYEDVIISVDGVPQIEGFTLNEWQDVLHRGIQRCVTRGRNLTDWDTYLTTKTWVDVPGQEFHIVDPDRVTYTTYAHGGKMNLQAIYFFDIETEEEQ